MNTVGRLIKTTAALAFDSRQFKKIIANTRQLLFVVYDKQKQLLGLTADGEIEATDVSDSGSRLELVGVIPALYPEWLGDRTFQETHHVRFAYIGGAMARGISSSSMVIELARCGMLGFFGAAGMSLNQLEEELMKIKTALDPQCYSWGANLIHTPDNLELEKQTIELYLRLGVKRISAASFMTMTPSLVYFACKGLRRSVSGQIIRQQFVFAKISRPEVAKLFLRPAPDAILEELRTINLLTSDEVEFAKQIPLAEDITVEADSGGHTDNRPLTVLFPVISKEREKIINQYNYPMPIRLGAAGGIGTPEAVSAAFAMGAAYVLLGTVHQACIESGLSSEGKKMLSQAQFTDVIMTASADMFELSSKVQVLTKGTMMGVRGNKLYQLYLQYDSIESIPGKIRHELEEKIFCMPLNTVWEKTKDFFTKIDARQIIKAEKNEKYKMALIFRWYLGKSSYWAINGKSGRQLDYQIWCGPAIGAFNSWCQGTIFEDWEDRKIRQVALNLMEGAAVITRAHQLKTYGLAVSADLFSFEPRSLRLT